MRWTKQLNKKDEHMTLGLSQITNDAVATIKFLESYGHYYDKWFITVADKDKKQYLAIEAWHKRTPATGKLQLSYYKWTNDFAAARNLNLDTIDTDYWMWADSDDTIEHPERIRELVDYMHGHQVDVIQLKYDYAQNAQGDAIADHWRERIISKDWNARWSTPVHEILQGDPCTTEKSSFVVVKHAKDPSSVKASMERNEKILRKHFEDTKDPRDAYYLGMTHLGRNEPEDAIQWFIQHIKTSGWDEDQYRSWCRIAEAEYLRDNHDQAIYATDEAIKLKPEFPDAYYIKVLVYGTREQFDKAIEWLKVAMAKPEPTTLAIVDPTLYKYRGMAMGAQCYLFSGRVKEAYKLYQYCMEQSEDAFTEEFQKLFIDAYYDQKATDYAKYLMYYLATNGGKPERVFESLPERIFADPRLNAERIKFIPSKTWPDKSIVFFCGAGNEQWGPDTLKNGLGGSEEAVIYLSRELAKLGWQVTVFGDRDEEYVDEFPDASVTYKPWTLLNPNDTFDVFVAWRAPTFTKDVKARKKLVDLHDTPDGHMKITKQSIENTDLFMFKTRFQHDYAPDIPESKVAIIPNGLVKEHFND